MPVLLSSPEMSKKVQIIVKRIFTFPLFCGKMYLVKIGILGPISLKKPTLFINSSIILSYGGYIQNGTESTIR